MALGITGSATAAAPPRQGQWLAYHSYIYSSDTDPTPGSAVANEGDSFISPFSLRLRALRGPIAEVDVKDAGRGQREAPTRIRFRIDDGESPSPGWSARSVDAAALLLRVANLDLPLGRHGELAAFYERQIAAGRWPWIPDQAQRDARRAMLEVDLASERGAAAALCRSVPILPLQNVATDLCMIEAIEDACSGWPIIARVTRTATSANRATSSQSITFERFANERTPL